MTSLRDPGAVLLISCYDLGRQPIAVASALATLTNAGFQPAAVDLAVDQLTPDLIAPARLAVLSVPMHTALRIGLRAVTKIRSIDPTCRTVFVGNYAALNAEVLFDAGADFVLSGEFEEPLRNLLERLEAGQSPEPIEPPTLRKIDIPTPRRDTLPALSRYARLEVDGESRVAGHTETSRGCRHLCRHCSLPPIYAGRFFVVPKEVVLADIRNQVRDGARHITFGDADFLNGPGHARSIVQALHAEFPELTFDFTAKVEHLLEQHDLLPEFAAQGCLFIVSAVESLNDHILEILAKDHTRADIHRALDLARRAGIALRPTWVAFTPWTTIQDYVDILDFIEQEDLIDHVDPVQLTLRLLVPPGSLLVDHPEMKPHLGRLANGEISYEWKHPDARMDALQLEVSRLVQKMKDVDDVTIFRKVRESVLLAAGDTSAELVPERVASRLHSIERSKTPPAANSPRARKRAPRLTEPWFC